MSVNEREEPAPAITAADIGFLRDMATDWNAEGEISEKYGGVDEERGGIWRKNTESCRRLSAHASRLADVLESFSGRSPAEGPPPFTADDVKFLRAAADHEDTQRDHMELDDEAVTFDHLACAKLYRSLADRIDAVWRSAQPHD